MPLPPSEPALNIYRVTCQIIVSATSPSHARELAAVAVENWSEETGWKHIEGIGRPQGYVLVRAARNRSRKSG